MFAQFQKNETETLYLRPIESTFFICLDLHQNFMLTNVVFLFVTGKNNRSIYI